MALKILIADDSEFMRNMVRHILLNQGLYEIYEASDGIECVKKYKENKPDLVLMDIMMPNKTGIEALKEIKNYDSNAKIIIVTALQKQNDFDEKKFGICAYINKPFDNEVMIEAVNDALDKK